MLPKKTKVKLGLKNVSVIAKLFWLHFCAPTTKDGSAVWYVGTVRYASIFAKKYGTPFL